MPVFIRAVTLLNFLKLGRTNRRSISTNTHTPPANRVLPFAPLRFDFTEERRAVNADGLALFRCALEAGDHVMISILGERRTIPNCLEKARVFLGRQNTFDK